MNGVEHIRGTTFHGRKGKVANAFRYAVDYVLIDAESRASGPRLFSRNRRNLAVVRDRDHGGAPGRGRGAAWLREVLDDNGLAGVTGGRVLLLTQPRLLGHVFNPVSFWLVHDAAGALRVVVSEVTSTFGDRHSYLCHRDDLGPIGPSDRVQARKVMHVSPFQPVAGTYTFRFDIGAGRLGIWIDYDTGDGEGLFATLTGHRAPLTDAGIVGALLRRPVGSLRVLGLIHWQALKLLLKGALYRSRPEAPAMKVSR